MNKEIEKLIKSYEESIEQEQGNVDMKYEVTKRSVRIQCYKGFVHQLNEIKNNLQQPNVQELIDGLLGYVVYCSNNCKTKEIMVNNICEYIKDLKSIQPQEVKTLEELGWYIFHQRKGFKHYRHRTYNCDYELYLHSDGTFFVNGKNNLELVEAIKLEITNMMEQE